MLRKLEKTEIYVEFFLTRVALGVVSSARHASSLYSCLSISDEPSASNPTLADNKH